MRKHKYTLFTLTILMAFASQDARPQNNADTPYPTEEKVLFAQVVPFSASKLLFGGFLSSEIDGYYQPVDGTSNILLEETALALQVGAEISDHLRIFATIEFSHEAEMDSVNYSSRSFGEYHDETALNIAFLEYTFSDNLQLRFGRQVTPFGRFNTLYYDPVLKAHHLPLFIIKGDETLTKNGHSHGDTSNTGHILGRMIDQEIQGIELLGRKILGNSVFGYHIYTGSFSHHLHAVGVGGRLFWSTINDEIILGTSFQTTPATMGHTSIDVDLSVDLDRWGFISEAIFAINHSGNHKSGFIVEPYVMISDNWLVFAQVDYINQEVLASGKDYQHAHTTVEVMETGGGINYVPSASVRYRMEVYWQKYLDEEEMGHEIVSRDYLNFTVSATVSF